MSESGQPNRLINEKSPYLRQHAFQPVNWYPWGEEAFDDARSTGRPIVLSIGYATCHWCHVMAHESFEDDEIARLMNRVFVSIKVDREERPDVDHLYMKAATLLSGGGGWPLTVVMTPEGVPFFAATYLPPHSISGRLGMRELVLRIESLWSTERKRIDRSGSDITAAMRQLDSDPPPTSLSLQLLDSGFSALAEHSDRQYGGLGSAPKFPLPHNLFFLYRYWKRTGDSEALSIARQTLDVMRRGGIFDHIGFGFHRYSTDRFWRVPHFEKMLYDQALLAMAYTEGAQITGNDEYQHTARHVFKYVFRDLTSPSGAFYSAEDADSEGKEGEFYLWTTSEIRQVLDPALFQLFCQVYSLRDSGHSSIEHIVQTEGKQILSLNYPLENWEKTLHIPKPELASLLEQGREILFKTRSARHRPLKDDKILTDWNGLMIASLACSARAWGDPELARRGAVAADFIVQQMTKPDRTLYHRYREGEAAIPGFLDDYAFLAWGMIELYQSLFDERYLEWALRLTEVMIELFEDSDGGFFFTGRDNSLLIDRPRVTHDSAIPSGNAVAVANLVRLHRLCLRPQFERSARKTLERFSGAIEHNPLGHIHLCNALDLYLGPSAEVIVVGDSTDHLTHEMLEALNRLDHLHLSVLFIPEDNPSSSIRTMAPHTQHYTSLNHAPTAYLCRDFTCQTPTTDLETIRRGLS